MERGRGEARRGRGRSFFFKQKTAYEILTCDWSADVCSSDLVFVGNSVESQTVESDHVVPENFISENETAAQGSSPSM